MLLDSPLFKEGLTHWLRLCKRHSSCCHCHRTSCTFQMPRLYVHTPSINLLSLVNVLPLMIRSLLQAGFQLRASLDNRYAAGLQRHTTLIHSELQGHCQVLQTTNQISRVSYQWFYFFASLILSVCHQVVSDKFVVLCLEA